MVGYIIPFFRNVSLTKWLLLGGLLSIQPVEELPTTLKLFILSRNDTIHHVNVFPQQALQYEDRMRWWMNSWEGDKIYDWHSFFTPIFNIFLDSQMSS